MNAKLNALIEVNIMWEIREKEIKHFQVNSRSLFMLLLKLNDLYNFSVCPNIFFLVF